jgi:hypothetical protein
MSFTDWINESKQSIRKQGIIKGSRESIRKFHYGALRNVEQNLARRVNVGGNVLNQEWDVLAIVDGCRHDLMVETAPQFDYLSKPEPFTSVAGGSLSWMRRTFTDNYEYSDVAYVTANPFSDRALDKRNFAVMDEVWRYAWDDEIGTVHAEAVTEAAVDILRRGKHDRAIVHYMQPHHPFVPNPIAGGINPDDPIEHDTTVWEKLRNKKIDHEIVWNGYRENLVYALNSIDTLRRNVAGPQLAVTADHGNALGEFGIYGHGDYPIPALRRVPWCMTSASDEHTLDPELERRRTNIEIEEQLRELGYR